MFGKRSFLLALILLTLTAAAAAGAAEASPAEALPLDEPSTPCVVVNGTETPPSVTVSFNCPDQTDST